MSWRTFKRGYIPEYVLKEKKSVVVVNPLTWTISDKFAPAKLNKGGLLKNFNKLVPGVVDAEVHGNVLWTSLPKFFGNIFLPTKNYHIADYNLFYKNIRENVDTRIRHFLINHVRKLKFRALRKPRKRNNIPNISHTGYKLHQPLKAKPKAGMRAGSKTAGIQVPAQFFCRDMHFFHAG